MSDFDEFERQLNENKQGESAGGEGQRAGRFLASLRVPRHFSRRFPLFLGPRGAPPPPVPRRAPRSRDRPACHARRGGGGGRRPGRMRTALRSAPRVVALEAALAQRARLVSPHGFMRFLIWKGDCIDESSNSFSPDALALPLPAG